MPEAPELRQYDNQNDNKDLIRYGMQNRESDLI